jgi:UDP-3-O-[3-hydroxymyristoyl] glucosamine N-acyltransferase
MRLSDLEGSIPFELVRDGEFDTPGLLHHESPNLLVALWERRFLNRELLRNGRITSVVTSPELAPDIPASLGVAVASDPHEVFAQIHELLSHRDGFYWRDFPSEIDPGARVHPAAYVASRNVRVGNGTVIEPHAVVLERCLLGSGVVLRAGCVVGAEGFHPIMVGGRLANLPHAGGVQIADGVEILSNSVVCRATFRSFTRIGRDSKLGTLVNVSHEVRIGQRCRIGTGASLTGSVWVGDDVWIGPNATVRNRARIGNGAAVSLGSVVVRDVQEGQRVSGNFAVDHREFLSSQRRSRR